MKAGQCWMYSGQSGRGMVCISHAEDTPYLSEGLKGHGVTVCSDKISQRETALEHTAAPEAAGSLKPDRFLQGVLNQWPLVIARVYFQTGMLCDQCLVPLC